MSQFNRQKALISDLLSHTAWGETDFAHFVTELHNLENLFQAYKPTFKSAVNILAHQPSFDGVQLDFTSRRRRRSLLPFLGSALKWLTGTATTKDIKQIKQRINELMTAQEDQRMAMIHIVSILNITRYETNLNRQRINSLISEVTTNTENLLTLYNITNGINRRL